MELLIQVSRLPVSHLGEDGDYSNLSAGRRIWTGGSVNLADTGVEVWPRHRCGHDHSRFPVASLTTLLTRPPVFPTTFLMNW